MHVPSLDAVPPAMVIESAQDMLRTLPGKQRADQRHELHVAVGETTEQFRAGYELGLQTARVTVLLTPDVRDTVIQIPNTKEA